MNVSSVYSEPVRGLGHAEHACACGFARGFVFCLGGHEVFFESVGGDYVGTALEELLAFAGCDFAHCGEAVGLCGGGFFERVF